MVSLSALRLGSALRLPVPNFLTAPPTPAPRSNEFSRSPPPHGGPSRPSYAGSSPKVEPVWRRSTTDQKGKQVFETKTLNYDPTDKRWLTSLPPDLPRPFWLNLTPESRKLHDACRLAFFNHQRDILRSALVQLPKAEWNALTDQERANKMRLDEDVRRALWEEKLPEREARELREEEVRRTLKMKANNAAQARRLERRKSREQEEAKEEQDRLQAVEANERAEADKVEQAKEAGGGGELDEVVAQPEAVAEPEAENEYGAGIPIERRRGRTRGRSRRG